MPWRRKINLKGGFGHFGGFGGGVPCSAVCRLKRADGWGYMGAMRKHGTNRNLVVSAEVGPVVVGRGLGIRASRRLSAASGGVTSDERRVTSGSSEVA